MSEKFNEFLLNRQKVKNENKVETKKSRHINELTEFYRTIKEWLADVEDKGLVTIEEWKYPSPNVDLTQLKLRFGTDTIIIKPELKNYAIDSITKVRMRHAKERKDRANLFVFFQNVWYFENITEFGFSGKRERLDQDKFEKLLQDKLK